MKREGTSDGLWLVTGLLRGWKVILGVTALAALTALALGRVLPKTYTAKTVLFLAQEGGGGDSRLQGLGSRLPAGLPRLSAPSANTKLVSAVLSSRSLTDSLARRVGKPDEIQISDDLDRSNSVIIQVSHRDPGKAAQIANTFHPLINTMVTQVTAETTRLKRGFLAGQLTDARNRLAAVEQRLVRFQNANNAPELQEQAKASLEAAGRLQQEIATAEVALAQLQRVTTPDNAEYRQAAAQLQARRAQLRSLRTGGGGSIFVPFSESAELKARATRLMAEYTEAQQIYASLTASLAEAQVASNNDLPVVTVLDPAIRPQSAAGLSTPMRVLIAMVLGASLGIVLVLAREMARRARTNPEHREVFAAWEAVKADLGLGRSRKRSGLPA